jgi:class 3 adenylate cyclase/tetratricopeptide (TPR) repeat protein
MTCPTCGTENEAGRKFCRECGTRLMAACPVCGTPNDPSAKFCGECGAAIGSAVESQPSATVPPVGTGPRASEPSVQSPTAERRLVSVLFADLVGFTSLSESRDPEAVRDLLGEYFTTARGIIERYGGTVEKFIGDAVMAVWGTPVAHEDDAERAVRSALDLVEAVGSMGASLGADLKLRAGVLTGAAAVTVGATNQGMVAGDLVNTASRLQSIAPPGGVLVGEATYTAASSAIAFEPAGEHVLKGKAEPVPAFRALRVIARRRGAGRSEQLEGPFVGRRAELRMLKDFHAATAAERRPRLVSILGLAGIGKTRLVWEFQKYMDGVTEEVYWHQGRSPAYGEGISFWALAEMVRTRAGIAEGEDADSGRTKLAAAVAQFVEDEGERSWLEGALGQLLGLEASSEEWDREQLFAAWRTFFERIAERGVVVLVFEDLQWADTGLLDFIDHVLDWSRDRPIYLISLARPELMDRRPDWGAGRRNFTSLVLEPLSDGEIRELLEGLVPGLPAATAARIRERAEGIPLYAVETVRMLLAEGHLERTDGAYRLVGDLSELSVPPSLHALIAARLDALEAADRTLLQAASVIGKTFSADAVTALTAGDRPDTEARLRGLCRRELLTLEADARSPERGQYSFVQSVIREVAYATLGRRDRRRLHLAAARFFETLGDEVIAGALAEHYRAAYHAQPEGPEGQAVAAQARVALRAAAERASALGSYKQALTYLEQALEVTQDPAERAQLEAAAGAAGLRGSVALGLPHLQAAYDFARTRDDRPATLRALTQLAFGLDLEGRLVDGLALLEPAAAEYADLAATAEYVALLGETARARMMIGREKDAVATVDAILGTAEQLELNGDILHLLVTRGASIAALGRVREATALLLGALEQARTFGDVELELRARVNLSFAVASDDPSLSYRVAREGVEIAERLGLGVPHAYLLGNAISGAVSIGDWDWAAQVADKAIEAGPGTRWQSTRVMRLMLAGLRGLEIDDSFDANRAELAGVTEPQLAATIDVCEAAVLLAHGELTRAYEIASASAERFQAPDNQADSFAARAALLLRNADDARRSLAAISGRPGRGARAVGAEVEAGIAALEGRPEAGALALAAVNRWRELGAQADMALCQLVMATLLPPGSRESRAAAEGAREIFTRLGARPLLEQLDRIPAGRAPARPAEVRLGESVVEAPGT